MNEVNNNSKINHSIDAEFFEQSQLLTNVDEKHLKQEKVLENVEKAIVKEQQYEETMQIEEKNDELETISLEGIKVWGQSQERLEAKALSQLNLLLGVKKENGLEDGELLKEQSDFQGKKEKGTCTLDIHKYIARQQQLKEKRESQKRIAAQVEKEQNIKRRELIEKKNKKTEKNKAKEETKSRNSDSEYIPSEEDEEIEQEKDEKRKNERCIKLKDDSLEANYKARLAAWLGEGNEEEEELSSGGAKVPGSIWSKLYEYQEEGVRWLWDLHRNKKGGLLADEMGLGKTIQVIALLAALQRLGERAGPSLVVCPATVTHQWLVQFHNWWPPIRIRLLHRSGGGDSLDTLRRLAKGDYARDGADVLVITYEGALRLGTKLERISWNYLILDEGHKIRNPFAKITIALKKLKAQHRLILTGTPMQNGLQELWSLLDFASPGTLGSLDAFLEHVATPVTRGGIEGASQSEQATAEMLAISLRDLLRPHLLRRTKKALKSTLGLPSKNEQVLFCALSSEQADLYQNYLASEPIASILGRSSGGWRRADVLVAINELRKISNHPDLYLQEGNRDPSRGGKTKVVSALLRLWRRQGHRALVFTQTRAALDILEETARLGGYKYLRMDGTTSVSRRQSLVDTFNSEEIYDVFLLTTRVGGLGINLTGADRVIICDPDWNPATDAQARERAWRIGQRKDVTVYRLVAAGTVEEKMFQRQVWKQLLCNQVLVDPRTQLCLKKNSLKELFSLQLNDQSETVKMYEQSQPEIIQKKKPKLTFSEDKLKDMRKKAREISRKIEQEQEEARPSPADLLAANRKKLLPAEEPLGNKIDDHDTGTSFHEALESARKFGEDYRRKRKKRHQEDPGPKVDISGILEGEKIEGLIKREVNIIKKKEQNQDNVAVDQDDYVLQKLFNKTGLRGALKHDDIIKEGSSQDGNSLRIHCESTRRAQKALDALRRSRLNNWRY